MRIDNASGTKAWLIGKFSGSFKGNLEGNVEGAASFARNACQSATASYMSTEDFKNVLNAALEDPSSEEIVDRLIRRGRLVIGGGIRVTSGSVEIDSGSVRIKKVRLEYDDDEDALIFKFTGPVPPEPPIPPGPEPPEPPPVPPVPPIPPVPPPPPPFPPRPPYPWPWPPRPPFDCDKCPLSSSCYTEPTGSGKKPRECQYSIDYYREGRY